MAVLVLAACGQAPQLPNRPSFRSAFVEYLKHWFAFCVGAPWRLSACAVATITANAVTAVHCDHKLRYCFLPLEFLVAYPSWVALIFHKNNIPERRLNQQENIGISRLIIWWLQMSQNVLSFPEFQRIRPARKRAPFGSDQEPRTCMACMADGPSRSDPIHHSQAKSQQS
jgi:hypothetical protein